jgi:hypothetical protein
LGSKGSHLSALFVDLALLDAVAAGSTADGGPTVPAEALGASKEGRRILVELAVDEQGARVVDERAAVLADSLTREARCVDVDRVARRASEGGHDVSAASGWARSGADGFSAGEDE